jgi:DNA (cytosine-5)-methyltransferase 1
MTSASLSSGYGGLEMALGRTPLWHSEIDIHAKVVLKHWWPEVPNLGDFTTPDFWEHAPRANEHMGGIPCQGFSAAGKQLGVADPRHLWPVWIKGIRVQRPERIMFENVANLTRGKMRPIFDGIIADLVAEGYSVRWCLLGACAVGAAHHRHRVFLFAWLSDAPSAEQVTVQTCGRAHAAYLPTTQARDGSTRGEGSAEFWERRREIGGVRATAGIPLGAALSLLPSPRGRDRQTRPGHGVNMQGGVGLPAALNMLPTPRHSDAKNGGPNQGIASGDIALSSAVQPGRWGKYAGAVARHEMVLGRLAPEPTEIGPRGGRRLAAAFSEWLMMLPQGHLTSVLDRNPALARAGNGVVPLQAATAFKLLGLHSH